MTESRAGKARADELLVQRGLASSRSQARALIMAREVRAGDHVIEKAGHLLDPSVVLEVRRPPRFVSRGGEKLVAALDAFGVDPTRAVCADIGASTGGFTDVLLQRGARRVYAVDAGYGQLDYRIRSDERVVVMERTNARYLETLPEPADLVTTDVSFISLRLILPVAYRLLRQCGACIALIKPQFEAGKGRVGKEGVVRDPAIHRDVLEAVVETAKEIGFAPTGLIPSPITGPAGNVEFLICLKLDGLPGLNLNEAIDRALAETSRRARPHG